MTKRELENRIERIKKSIKDEKGLLENYRNSGATISEAMKVRRRLREYERELRGLRIRYNPQLEIFDTKAGK